MPTADFDSIPSALFAVPWIDLDVTHRPARLSDLVGQPLVTSVLTAQLEAGALSGAFLFSGPHGVGKTTSARILALAMNCENRRGIDACGECSSCRRIRNGEHELVLEINSGSDGGIDNIRRLTANLQQLVPDDGWRVVILDEAHGLTGPAVAALLKPLEESPPRTTFVLATTEPQRLAETLRSRCVQLPFGRVADADLIERCRLVAADIEMPMEDDDLQLVAARSGGSLRAALELMTTYRQGREAWQDQTLLPQQHAAEFWLAVTDDDAAAALMAIRSLMVAVCDDKKTAIAAIIDVLVAMNLRLRSVEAPDGLKLQGAAAGIVEKAARRCTVHQASQWMPHVVGSIERLSTIAMKPDSYFLALFLNATAAAKAPASVQAPAQVSAQVSAQVQAPVSVPAEAQGPFSWEAAEAVLNSVPSLKRIVPKLQFKGLDAGCLLLASSSGVATAMVQSRHEEIVSLLAGLGVRQLELQK